MRYWSISFSLLLLTIVSAVVAGAEPVAVVVRAANIRAIDHAASVTLTQANERSPIVRSLMAQLAASDLVIHLQFSLDLPAGLGGMTQFVSYSGGYRYVRITLSSRLRREQRMSMLGHELQHALEIAQSGAHDLTDLHEFLDAVAYQSQQHFFETRLAIETERSVREELRTWKTVTSATRQ